MRHFQHVAIIERAAVAAASAESREIDFALSSETPVERYFGTEILDHSKAAVDLTRLADGRHPLLVQHDQRDQVGVVNAVTLGDDRMLRVRARFGRSARAQEIYQDVQDGIRSLVSTGYEILQVSEESRAEDGTLTTRELTGEEFHREMRAKFGELYTRTLGEAEITERAAAKAPPVYRVTRWQPLEASIVSIPADPNVGVGRAAGAAPAAPTEPAAAPGGAAGASAPAATASPEPDTRASAPTTTARITTIMETPTTNQPSELEVERVRTKAIADLGEQYAKYVTGKEVGDAIRNARTVEQFRDTIMQKMESAHTDTRALHLGMNDKEIKHYSIARAVVAAITGDWREAGLERAASQAVEKLVKSSPEGFYVPYDAFVGARAQRDFNAGTAGEAGNLIATELRTDLYTDALRNQLVLAKMGIRILGGLTGNINIPRKSVAGTSLMKTEIQALTETNPTTALVSLSPKRLGAYVEYSKQALIQSSLALEPMLRDDLLSGNAQLLEDQMFNGSGSSPNIRGIRNTSGIGSVAGGTNGLAPAWSHFVDLESACANSNAEPDQLAGYVVNTRTRGKLKQTQKATNLQFIWDNGDQPLNGYRAAVSNVMPNNLTKGTSSGVASSAIFSSDFSMWVLALFGAPDVVVDPYSLATTGQVRITLNQFADAVARNAAYFASIDDLLAG
jgi:HK97 family phage major capsid protein